MTTLIALLLGLIIMMGLEFTPGTLVSIGSNCSKFDDEVAAAHMALTEITYREEQNIVIFIDSQATIRNISSIMPSKIIMFLNINFLSTP
ncbi:hypothetical protein CDAR_465951 [Caerostris darwini]|uniref:RNase H type-1 domain-containing protein n=1 Tax=Caerostris darwini TaxID=1538125 RepID=A0AAV4VZV1_9ARAC|nr:hypothetical protein CDAR_465951 [Caerostris darwini]